MAREWDGIGHRSRPDRWPPLRVRLARYLKEAAIAYAILFASVFLLALASAYVWPWLLAPVPTEQAAPARG